MSDYPDNPSPKIAKKREALFRLYKNAEYDRAADLALATSAEVNMFMPVEDIADRISKKRPKDAFKLYAVALANAQTYAGFATSGGEGMCRMAEVRRIKDKLEELRADGRTQLLSTPSSSRKRTR